MEYPSFIARDDLVVCVLTQKQSPITLLSNEK